MPTYKQVFEEMYPKDTFFKQSPSTLILYGFLFGTGLYLTVRFVIALIRWVI